MRQVCSRVTCDQRRIWWEMLLRRISEVRRSLRCNCDVLSQLPIVDRLRNDTKYMTSWMGAGFSEYCPHTLRGMASLTQFQRTMSLPW